MILHAFCAMNSNGFIEELPHEELRQSIFTGELEVADRLVALSERICREFVFFLRIFESRNCDISEDITELIKQLLKLYEGLTERYRERINWLEEDRDDNSFRCQPESVNEGNARSRGRPQFSISKSQIEGLRDLGFTWSKIAAMIGVSRITLHSRIRELGRAPRIITSPELRNNAKIVLTKTSSS